MSTQPNEPEWLGYALREYEYHRSGIDKFDEQRLQIRNWSITVSGALLAVAFSARIALIAYGSVLVALLFFFLEAIYMRIEHDVIQRSDHIERLINNYRKTGQLLEPYEFGASYAYRGNFYFKDMRRVIFRRGRVHLTAFHGGLLVIAVLGAVTAGLTLPTVGDASPLGTTTPANQHPPSTSPTPSR